MTTRKEIIELIIRAQDETKRTFDDVAKEIDGMSNAQAKNTKSSGEQQKALNSLEQEADKLVQAFKELEGQDRLIKRFKEQEQATKRAGREWRSLKDGVGEYQKIINQSGAPTQTQTRELERLGKAADFAAQKYQKQRKALARTTTEMRQSGLAARNVAQSQEKIKNATDKTRQALERNRTALVQQKTQFDTLRASASRAVSPINKLRSQLVALASTITVIRGVVKAFGDFQSGLIGVGKTTNIEGAELDQFGDDIQQLSKQIPVSTKALLELAQAAGQLGVKGGDNLLKFSRTMAELAEASDVSGEAGARDIVRILGITDENIDQVDQFTNVLVGLGNELAATEQEILEVATRVAQGTAAFKLSSNQILGFSGGMKALGIQSELAGSSTQKAFIKIQSAIREGGEELITLEQITGKTREELENLFQTDQAGLFEAFIAGLNRVKNGGGDVITTLKQLGITEIRTVQVLATLSNGYTTFANALRTSEREAKNNNARSLEADKVFKSLNKTIESVGIATDRLGQEFGELISPAVERLLDRTARKINSLGDAIERINSIGRGSEGGGISAQGPFEKILTSLELMDAVAFDVLFGKQIKAIKAFTGSAEEAGKKSSDAFKKIAESQKTIIPATGDGDTSDITDHSALAAQFKAKELLEQASIEKRRRINEQALQAQEVSVKAYFDNRVKIEQDAIDLLIKAKQREVETTKENAVAQAELKILIEQRAEVETQAIKEKEQAEQQLALRTAELRNQLLAAQGDEAQAKLNELGINFAQEIQTLLINGDQAGVELATKLFNIELVRIQFDQLEDEFQRVMQNLASEQQRLHQEVAIGDRTQLSATTELNQLREEAKIKLQALVEEMRNLAEASEDPRLKTSLMEMEQQITGVRKRITVTADDINSRFAAGFSNAFTDFVSGTQSAKDAFKEFAAEFLIYIAKMILQKTIFNALSEQEGSNPGGSIGGLIAGLFKAPVFHEGGIVGQGGGVHRVMPIHEFINAPRFHKGGFPGGLRSNERAAILETGEEVLSRKDPRNALNQEAGGAGGGRINQTIINTIDADEVSQAGLQSSATDDVFVNKIGRNKQQIKNLLKD